jgi:hypothetical protein
MFLELLERKYIASYFGLATAHGWGRHKVNLDAKDLRLVLIVR